MNNVILKWHVLSRDHTGTDNAKGMRAGVGAWRADIYAEPNGDGFFMFTCVDGEYGQDYHFDDIFKAMWKALELFTEYQIL